MLDYMNEVFTTVANDVRAAHSGTKVVGEFTRSPAQTPLVALDETENVEIDSLIDSSHSEDFAGLQYRLQVFSGKKNGKKAEARAIFATADASMRGMGFRRKTYSTTPEIYNSTIYSITATYEAIVDNKGYSYRRN